MASFFQSTASSAAIEENKKKIDAYFEEADIHNDVQLKHAVSRNIMFLGKTRSGKSTALNVLKDLTFKVGYNSIFSETEDARLYSFTVNMKDAESDINYNVSIIDTPGLFEQRVDRNDTRTNESLKKTISKCMEYEITKIHAIFLVCSFETGINENDILAIKEFLALFKGAEDSISLLITRGEEYSPEHKQRLIDDLLRLPSLSDVVDIVRNKIFFTGAIKQTDFDSGAVNAVKRNLENVYNMRRTLYEYIFQKEGYCQISQLDFYRVKQQETQSLLENIANAQLQQKRGATTTDYDIIWQQLQNLKGFISEDNTTAYLDLVEKHKELKYQQ